MQSFEDIATVELMRELAVWIGYHLSPVLFAGFTALLVGLLVVGVQCVLGRAGDTHSTDIQRAHTRHAARVGGLAIVAGVAVGFEVSPPEVRDFLRTLLLAVLPFGLIGLIEDLTGRITAKTRLWLSLLAALLAVAWCGAVLRHTDIWFIDAFLGWTPAALAFSVIAVAGVSHAINIIDGHHGQAGLTVVFSLLGLALMALDSGDLPLLTLAVVVAASVLGFLCLNWPLGRLFMGDGGAYFLGALLAIFSILLVQRNPDITPLAVLLVSAYPVLEVLFSIWRRRKSHKPVDHPDRLHMHSLLRRRVIQKMLPPRFKHCGNPITGLVCSAFTLVGVLLALQVARRPADAIAVLAAMVLGYLMVYARLVRFHWCAPWTLLVHSRRTSAPR